MTVQLNHTVVAATDRDESAAFLASVLGLPKPTHFGPFFVVETDNGVSLDFIQADGDVRSQHYAFQVSEDEFDEIVARLDARDVTHYADPGGNRSDEINHNDGGRGAYFSEPSGHWLEIITRPYGG